MDTEIRIEDTRLRCYVSTYQAYQPRCSKKIERHQQPWKLFVTVTAVSIASMLRMTFLTNARQCLNL